MDGILGRPLQQVLESLPAGQKPPAVQETAAPLRPGQERRAGGTARIVACREDRWIVARFWDEAPREKEDE